MPNQVWLMDFSCEATSTNYFVRLSILTMSSMISYSSSEHHILIILSFIMIICVVLNKMPEDFVRREKVGAREQQVKGSVIDMIPHLKKNPKWLTCLGWEGERLRDNPVVKFGRNLRRL